jgi:hypothetical protein
MKINSEAGLSSEEPSRGLVAFKQERGGLRRTSENSPDNMASADMSDRPLTWKKAQLGQPLDASASGGDRRGVLCDLGPNYSPPFQVFLLLKHLALLEKVGISDEDEDSDDGRAKNRSFNLLVHNLQ